LIEIKTEGKGRAELQENVMGWYVELEGEAKEKAGKLLKAGCRELTWVTDAQIEEIKEMKEAGKTRAEREFTGKNTKKMNKVTEWFDATEMETRQRAWELMQAGCHAFLKMVWDEEKAIKEIRESGTAMEKIETQIDELVSTLDDDDRKKGMIMASIYI
jgi:hypothetical protein